MDIVFSRLLGNKHPSIEELQQLLAQARRYLWHNELLEAKTCFLRGRDSATELRQDSKTVADTAEYLMQVNLGLWAIDYFQGKMAGEEYQRILAGKQLNAETAFFIARVFQLKRDRTPSALRAYQTLLHLNPSVKLAERISELVVKLEFSLDGLALLEVVAEILQDQAALSRQLCRWYLLAGKETEARTQANKLLVHSPSDREGHRCLAYLAEKSGDWELSARHYRASEDWVRTSIVLVRLEYYDDALQALERASDAERRLPAWSYYRGWIAYQQGEFQQAVSIWRTLVSSFPEYTRDLSKSLKFATRQLILQLLQANHVLTDSSLFDALSTAEHAIVELHLGAKQLMIARDTARSKPLLESAAKKLGQNSLAEALLLVCEAETRSDPHTDLNIYRSLTGQGGDPSLFMWLRGLSLLKSQPAAGARYLAKALIDGVDKRHLPAEAANAAAWLVTRIVPELSTGVPSTPPSFAQLEGVLEKNAAFVWSVLPTYMADWVRDGKSSSLLAVPGPESLTITETWKRVQTVHFLRQGELEQALDHAVDMDSELRWRIVRAAIRKSLCERSWQQAARCVREGLSLHPDDNDLQQLAVSLRPHIYESMWRQGQLEILDRELEKEIVSGNASTNRYHLMAIVYTQLALKKDAFARANPESAFLSSEHRTQSAYSGILEAQPHNDYWQLAIGYWSVAVSDFDYWKTWGSKREAVYGEPVAAQQLRELIEVRIPRLLRDYHSEQVTQNTPYATHHRFYAAIVDREIEHSRAMRYFLREAERQKLVVHKAAKQFVSPLLLKEYGYEAALRTLVGNAAHLNLSPYEGSMLSSASTPLDDVKALVDIKEYPMALHRLRELRHSQEYAEFYTQTDRELGRTLMLAAEHALDGERWDTAYELAEEGVKLQPGVLEFETLLVKALIGWAEQKAKEEDYASAIRRLELMSKQLHVAHHNLDNLLSEIYVEWAFEAGRDDDFEKALTRFEKAISINSSNARACQGAYACHYDRAVGLAQAANYAQALSSAVAALNYQEDAHILRLVAMLHRSMAIAANESHQIVVADGYWIKAQEFAERLAYLTNAVESLDLYVEMSVGRVLFLYSRGNYSAALDIGEALLSLDYDPDALELDLEELLSAICTDYGAAMYNNGNRWQGKQLMQKAVRYDPGNSVARQNLYRM